jgi:hypothetical protein
MSELNGTSSVTHKLPATWHTIVRGILLGIVVALMGSCLLMALLHVFASLADPSAPPLFGNIDTSVLILYAMSIVVFFIFAVVPGSVGGGVIALVLQRLARRGRLTTRTALRVGVLVGLCAGCATALIVHLLVLPSGQRMVTGGPVWTTLFAVGIGALAGLFHSWCLSNWLRKRLT